GPTLVAGSTLSITPASLTGSIANQTKTYGADDPTLSGIAVSLGGLVNRTVVDWNGTNPTINDSALSSTVTALTRAAGENVGSRAITAGTFSAASGNYSAPTFTGTPTLTISQASLTGSIANQTKVYGADDPALSGIAVTLTGLVNNPAVVTWNGNVAIDDSALSSSVTSLTRVVGESVGVRNITAGTFGAVSGNYSGPTFTGTPTLTVTPATLTGSIANQTKVYGADDPTLSGITVNLGGVVNNPALVTWNGTVSVNDTGNVATTLASLTRNAGEAVSGSPYTVTAGTFNALTGTAAGNYSAPSFTGTPTLTVTAANLTGTVVNRTVTTWNGSVAIDDSALTSTTTALTRTGGETVAGTPYSILTGTFTTPSGNYNGPTLVAGSTLSITPAGLTATVVNQTKTYGADDPTLSGIAVSLGGLVNRSVLDWNGTSTAINDSALSSTVTALTRAA